ncbi:MAG: hypothetical protein H8E22_08570 [Candidatus Cloacimonetes bacterium]|nr:hypothetical protein [Candidatus Cloacimonadota bacterium]
MKKVILLSLLLFLIAYSVACAVETRRYAIKSGHVLYELTGNITGEKEVWFDDYGMKYYEEENSTSTIKMFGITNTEKEHTIMIMDGETIYDIDMLTKTGSKGTLPSMEQLQDMAENMTKAEQKQFADDIMNSFGGKHLGTEKFLGKTCEVMEIMGMKSWIYNGLTLKSEVEVMGIVTNETATSFKENIKVPASRFDPPKGITYEDVPAFGNMFDSEGSEDDEEYEESESVSISFKEFQNGLSGLSSSGYMQTMIMEEEDQYIAMYMKGMAASIMITATAIGDADGETDEGFESFSHKGHQMMYAKIVEGGMNISVLVVVYPQKKLLISVNAMTDMSKEDLISIADNLKF